MITPAYKMAGRQLLGTAEGLRSEAKAASGARRDLLLVFAETLEAITEAVGIAAGDVPESGPISEVPSRVAAALQGTEPRDEHSFVIAKRLLSTARKLEDGGDDYEIALGTTLVKVAEVGNAVLSAPDGPELADVPKAVRGILGRR